MLQGQIFVIPASCDQPASIVSSKDQGEATAGENVLQDCSEEEEEKYWKAPVGKIGSGAELVMEIGCFIQLQRISLRNGFGDFGTERFSLWGARSRKHPWVLLHNGTLAKREEKVKSAEMLES